MGGDQKGEGEWRDAATNPLFAAEESEEKRKGKGRANPREKGGERETKKNFFSQFGRRRRKVSPRRRETAGGGKKSWWWVSSIGWAGGAGEMSRGESHHHLDIFLNEMSGMQWFFQPV